MFEKDTLIIKKIYIYLFEIQAHQKAYDMASPNSPSRPRLEWGSPSHVQSKNLRCRISQKYIATLIADKPHTHSLPIFALLGFVPWSPWSGVDPVMHHASSCVWTTKAYKILFGSSKTNEGKACEPHNFSFWAFVKFLVRNLIRHCNDKKSEVERGSLNTEL